MKCNVKENTVPFEFDGKEFQLKFNLNVMAEIQDKYGDMDTFIKNVNNVKDLLWILCLLMNQDVKKHNKSSDKKWEFYTEEDLGEDMLILDIQGLSETVAKAMTASLPQNNGDETEKNETAE